MRHIQCIGSPPYLEVWKPNACFFGILEIGGTTILATQVAAGASALIGAYGAISSAGAKSSAANYSAEVAANNAQIAEQNATRAAASGEQQAAMASAKTRATVGALKANEAASGVDVNTGSAVDVRSSAASLGELDALTIRSNAARTAYGYQTDASNQTAQSQLDKFEAKNDETAGEIGAGTSILGGVSSAANNYAKFTQTNGFGGAAYNPGSVMWNTG